MTGPAPLVITAELPTDLFSWANQLRVDHYPVERNWLKAHVTLFHALPPGAEGEVSQALARMARDTAPLPAVLAGIMSLGKGTALRIDSPAMIALWDELAERFHGLLTPQDQHPPRLHITVQNKVTPQEASRLQADLAARIEPRAFAFSGLGLHAYRGGPWERLGRYAFRKAR